MVGSCIAAGRLTKHGSVGSSEFNEAVSGEVENWSLFSINKDTKHLHKYSLHECKSIYRFAIRCCEFQNKRAFSVHRNASCVLVKRRQVKMYFKSSPDKRVLACFLSLYTFYINAQNDLINNYMPKQNFKRSHQHLFDHTYFTNIRRTVSSTKQLLGSLNLCVCTCRTSDSFRCCSQHPVTWLQILWLQVMNGLAIRDAPFKEL